MVCGLLWGVNVATEDAWHLGSGQPSGYYRAQRTAARSSAMNYKAIACYSSASLAQRHFGTVAGGRTLPATVSTLKAHQLRAVSHACCASAGQGQYDTKPSRSRSDKRRKETSQGPGTAHLEERSSNSLTGTTGNSRPPKGVVNSRPTERSATKVQQCSHKRRSIRPDDQPQQYRQKSNASRQLMSTLKNSTTPQQLLQLAQQHGKQFDQIHIAAAVTHLGHQQSKKRIKAADHQTVQELLRLLEQQLLSPQTLQRCECRELSNILWACCKLKYVHTPLLRICLGELIAKLSSAQSLQDVSMVLYGLAKFRVEVAMDQVQQLIEAAGRLDLLCEPQEVSNTIWAVATMGLKMPEHQLHSMLAVASGSELLHKFKPQEISNIIWAVATMGLEMPEQQLHSMLAVASGSELLHKFKPQEISNIIWAVAKMGLEMPEQQLHSMLAAAAGSELLHKFKPQEISNIIWAVATMGLEMPEQQLHSMLEAAAGSELLHKLKPQEIANIIGAVATMGQKIPNEQLDAMLATLVSMSTELVPQNVSNTLWGLATMTADVPLWPTRLRQLQQLEDAFVAIAARAKPNELSNTLWACAELLFYPQRLLSALQQQQLWNMLLPSMKSQELANTALAIGTLGHGDEQLMGNILQQAVKLLPQKQCSSSSSVTGQFNMQEVCNLCWAVAVLDLQQYAAEVVSMMGTCSDQWDSLKLMELQQVQQVHLWLQDMQQPQAMGLQRVLSQQQLQQCRAAWAVQLQQLTQQQTSAFQAQVFEVLQLLPVKWQVSPAMEQLSEPDEMFSIDISAVIPDGVRLAVEADGPTHFRKPDRGLTGKTLYRNRALAARGYVVISVAGHEWKQLQSQHQQLQYLQRLLQESLPQLKPTQQSTAGCNQQGGSKLAKQAKRQTVKVPAARLLQLIEEPQQMQPLQRQQQQQRAAPTSGISRVRRVRRKVK